MGVFRVYGINLLLTVNSPNQFFAEAQQVVGHLEQGKVDYPEVSVHKGGDRKPLQVGLFCPLEPVTRSNGYVTLELYPLYLANDAGLEHHRPGHQAVLRKFPAVPGIIVSGEDKGVLIFKVNVKAIGAPWFIVNGGADGQHMVLLEKLNYSGVGEHTGYGLRVAG